MYSGSIDQQEVEKFAKIAEEWWDEEGSFKPLHQLNPVRIGYIRDMIKKFHGGLKGTSVLDVGCGGGLISIPVANMGAEVLGIDVTEENVKIAYSYKVQHEIESNVKFQYISIEQLALQKRQFEVVLVLEVVEHVANLASFVANAMKVLKPGGVVVFSTLNKTLKSYLMAIMGAEYILRWLPNGTHEWSKFVKPAELINIIEQNDGHILNISGVVYNFLRNQWMISNNIDVNYMLAARKNG